jgi:hypothetical protein
MYRSEASGQHGVHIADQHSSCLQALNVKREAFKREETKNRRKMI